ncbi:MAG: hypothetical protein AVDCRST_MAG56-1344 [uncultured Cytophagales bacterium]|uniref:Uncharacterized protein n=1 Tax=uncultured Cytophagales bacterium TaxID=158755 RepID=A0A6J4HWY2_9SPHI|nr:MAG: hypothetical protein AVDCRST_MAG56-1344 [uncultured Cytophagales bacterium]
MIFKKQKALRRIALLMAVHMLGNALAPAAYALTGGPGAPEFASFEPVATTDMVNTFTGDFTYNLPVLEIPGPDGSGYALSLSYHGGSASEEESSWVGFGFSLNPGAINRTVRGFPDEYKGVGVDYYNKVRPNWSMTASQKLNMEFFSKDMKAKMAADNEYNPLIPTASLGTSLRYNNYQGYFRSYSLGVGLKGVGNLDMTLASSGYTFSANINPLGILNRASKVLKKRADQNASNSQATKKEVEDKTFLPKTKEATARRMMDFFKRMKPGGSVNMAGSEYGLFTFSEANRASSVAQYKGFALNATFAAQINPGPIPVGLQAGLSGSFNMHYNVPKQTNLAYGYLHNPKKDDYENGIMADYYVEKGNAFEKQDYVLGIPFANPDMFAVSGEGLGGGFRPYSVDPGHYYPNFVASDMNIMNIGFETMVGTNVGVGVNSLGMGNQKTNVQNWGKTGDTDNYQFDGDQAPVYRFNNDLGGKITYAANDLYTARLNVSSRIPGFKSVAPAIVTPEAEGTPYGYINEAGSAPEARRAAGASSFIEHTSASGPYTVYNEDGMRYKYGEVVYAKNDANLSVDVEPGRDRIEDNYLVYKNLHYANNHNVDLNRHKSVVGEVKQGEGSQYASTYLLTEITTPDYVDANGDDRAGDEDFGGWTRFAYEKAAADYRWRIPYTGLLYQKNQISDVKDDMGSVVTGEKEIKYLSKIETKTHIAYFVRNTHTDLGGSGKDRLDGLGAYPLDANGDPAAGAPDKKGTQKLERLEKIVLYAKDRPNQPIKTVHFQYDYSLVPNLPNNLNGQYPANRRTPAGEQADNSGKLTLKRVWFEYEGVSNARISPYEFVYHYKDRQEYPNYLVTNYPALASFFNLSRRYSANAQNPAYNPHALDAWGGNQAMGALQKQLMRPWPYQGDLSGQEFDPAAWQLKGIKLPSGGEILVEYEQKDYRYVQDREVMAMVSLQAFDEKEGGVFGEAYAKNPTYTVQLADMGIDASSQAQVDGLVAKMEHYFRTEQHRMYFKFLYDLTGNSAALDNCTSEYITGYAKVAAVQRVDDPAAPGRYTIKVTLDGTGSGYGKDGYLMVPRQACYDFYSTQRVGKYKFGCEGEPEQKYDEVIRSIAYREDKTGLDGFKKFLATFGFAVVAITDMQTSVLEDATIQPPIKATVCKTLNTHLSYLKIPMPKAKRGGGFRVKRLLMHDAGLETLNGDAVIYGSEYTYEGEDGLSSGVATTEPSDMREENPLVGFMPRKEQSWLSRHTSGSDKEQSEGPLGESLLPGPSVGHSRVIVSNIHQGETGNGFVVNDFHTSRDYPYDKVYNYAPLAGDPKNPDSQRQFDFAAEDPERGVEFTSLTENREMDPMVLPTPVFNYSANKLWATQGFRFVVSNMHGQPQSVRTYSGSYPLYKADKHKVYLSSAQNFKYFEPGEMVRVLRPDGKGGAVVAWDTPGKEMDLVMEMKSVKDRTMDFGLEVDISASTLFPPPIFVGLWPSFDYSEKVLSTHVTTKVIRYPAMQRGVEAYQDGIWSLTENVAFDQATGKPLLTKTTDAFHNVAVPDPAAPGKGTPHNGTIHSLVLPAHWYYPELGSRVATLVEPRDEVPYRTNQLNATAGSVTAYGDAGRFINAQNQFGFPVTNVLSAKVQTFTTGKKTGSANTPSADTYWYDDGILGTYGAGASTTQEATGKLMNVLRPYQEYVYRTSVTEGPIYSAGTYKSFKPFDFGAGTQAPEWTKVKTITRYSPHGNPLEEENIMGIRSAARFGYRNTLPVIIGQNAEYSSLYFQDYETTPDNAPNPNVAAHSGSGYKQLQGTETIVQGVKLVERKDEKQNVTKSNEGGVVKLWLRTDGMAGAAPQITVNGKAAIPGHQVARTGEWALFSFVISKEYAAQQSVPLNTPVSIDLAVPGADGAVYLDDVRYQPLDGQATCYVYDKATLRLITQFDDQHFGLYYQYNDEGKLVRKLIETEKGLKTVQETQYNTPKTARN